MARENIFLGLLYTIIFFPLILSVFIKKQVLSPIKKFTASLFILIATLFTGFVLFPDAVWDYYLIGLPVIYLLLMALALLEIKKAHTFMFLPFTILLLFLATKPIAVFYARSSQWVGDASVYKNQKQAIDYIYNEAQGEAFSTVVYTPALIDYPYQYLFSWYGKSKYGYEPSEGEKTAFYILEPGNESLQRHWLDQRKGDGEVVEERTMTGDIIVQKRIRTRSQL